MGGGNTNTLGCGQLRCGGGGVGQQGGQQWGCLQPLRTALHTISISMSPKQFELKQS